MGQLAIRETPEQALQRGDAKGFVGGLHKQLGSLLPQHMQEQKGRYSRILLTVLRQNEKLMEVAKKNPASLIGAVMHCVQLGLEPGVGQMVHLIPYGKEVQVIVGYQGYVELARRAGVTIHPPRVVREGDEFEIDYGSVDRQVIHRPAFSNAPLTHVWCMATEKGRAPVVEVMSRAQVEAVKSQALSGKPDWLAKKSPWQDHFEEMARKTVVRRLAKYLPKSAEFQEFQGALATDGQKVRGFTQSGEAEMVLEGETVDPEQAELDALAAKDAE